MRCVRIENAEKTLKGRSAACLAVLPPTIALVVKRLMSGETLTKESLEELLDEEVCRVERVLSSNFWVADPAGQQTLYNDLIACGNGLIARNAGRRASLFALFLQSLAEDRLKAGTPGPDDIFIIHDTLGCLLVGHILHGCRESLEEMSIKHFPELKKALSREHARMRAQHRAWAVQGLVLAAEAAVEDLVPAPAVEDPAVEAPAPALHPRSWRARICRE
eukprot:Gregarina_sp_Pseudo_9__861@NODE_1552_length_1502_cov_10_935065_g1439_i0_p2_GENE_NODE_1552_length_1502_cov_10_935065_g1439_i0NODE_1552_length_1502_cov_10_935065_g1439_i0_p2_ORF_typecomplete_len220_score13_81DUF1192/PF06698_11/1_4e03DUF1192/PF06698_11/0_19Mnd1/PF03962_15/0_49_NODE_1552_length_1502_cov_10_935065_g1439_i07481407